MSVERIYWDSDCFLGWLQAEADKEKQCREVLEAATDGKARIVTSALTIAEVLAVKNAQPIPASMRQKVEAFFCSDYIVVRNITRKIAEDARTYVWDYKVAPKDALHVSTAINAGLGVLHTFDAGLISKSGLIGDPTLTIQRPLWREPKLPFGGAHDKSQRKDAGG